MISYLKPCPFCGSDAKYAKRENRNLSGWSHEIDHWVFCIGDDCLVHMGMGETKEEVVQMWNARADLAAPGWQPIETAPRDGTEILVLCPYDGVVSSHFRHGCWQKLSTILGYGSDPNEPTHWMPLPKPPLTKEN